MHGDASSECEMRWRTGTHGYARADAGRYERPAGDHRDVPLRSPAAAHCPRGARHGGM